MDVMDDRNKRLPELLAYFPCEVLKEFLHRCLDELCGREGPSIAKVCSATKLSAQDYADTLKQMKSFLINAVVYKYDRTEIENLLLLNEDQSQSFATCLDVHKQEIQEFLLETISKTHDVSLQDFDWKIKWMKGSSSLASLEGPLLELDLCTEKREVCGPLSSSIPVRKCVSVELNQENLSQLISALEMAYEALPK